MLRLIQGNQNVLKKNICSLLPAPRDTEDSELFSAQSDSSYLYKKQVQAYYKKFHF